MDAFSNQKTIFESFYSKTKIVRCKCIQIFSWHEAHSSIGRLVTGGGDNTISTQVLKAGAIVFCFFFILSFFTFFCVFNFLTFFCIFWSFVLILIIPYYKFTKPEMMHPATLCHKFSLGLDRDFRIKNYFFFICVPM